MYKVKFDTGETISFENQPTDADIQDAVKQLGIKPKNAIIPETQPEKGVLGTNPNDSLYGKVLDNSITRGIQSIFPGKKLGQSIGESINAFTQLAKTGDMNALRPQQGEATPLQVAGDVANIGLTATAPLVGGGPTALGRIGANTALGVGLGTSNAISEGKNAGEVVQSGALGGAIGGGLSGLGEGTIALTKNLPNWLTKMALPKLDRGNIDYALKNTKIGSLSTLQKNSNSSMKSYENTVQSILNHPEFKQPVYTPASTLSNVIEKFPNASYTVDDIMQNAKDIAPNVSKLITKFEQGTANLQEVNIIRKELDSATKSIYTSLSRPPEKKLLGAALSNQLRTLVKTEAPATEPVFELYSREIGLNKALQSAIKKGENKVGLTDIIAAGGGFAHGGFTGALEAILAERLLRNPASQLGVAKVIQKGSKAAVPVAKTALQGLKAPIIKSASNR